MGVHIGEASNPGPASPVGDDSVDSIAVEQCNITGSTTREDSICVCGCSCALVCVRCFC